MASDSAKKLFPVKKQLDKKANFNVRKNLEVLIQAKLSSLPAKSN